MISRLAEKIKEKNNPSVAGLDPNLGLIPDHIKKESFDKFGKTLEGAAFAVWEFNRQLIDALCDIVPAVKPQIAMYEQFGLPGMAVYKNTVDYAHEKGLIVIGDIKRGDIGSTSLSYAAGHLGETDVDGVRISAFNEDFATVNPYLGIDGVSPFIDVCNSSDKGIFVLVKTSNPSSGDFQDRLIDGRPLYEIVGEKVNEWGKESMDGDYSNVGAVVGATYPEMGRKLRAIMPKAFILVPGYGAQGGKGEDLKAFFNSDGLGAIINSSRGIIGAWKKDGSLTDERQFALSARRAAIAMKEDIERNVFAV